jgi:hypothetical protein
MPDSESALPALWDHCTAATRAFGGEAGLSFSTFSVNESEFQFVFPSMANRLLEACCFETQGEKRVSLLLLVLASRQRWLAGC